MKKICFIVPTTELGGGPKHLYDLIRSLDLSEWDPFLCTQPDGPYWDKFQKLNIRTYPLALRRISFKTPLRLASILRKEQPDLIHTHGSRAGFYGRIVGGLSGIPVIHTYHGFRYNHLSNLLKIAYIAVEYILSLITTHHICVGEGEMQRTAILKFTRGRKFSVIYNGIDIEAIRNLTIDKEQVLRSLGLEKFLHHTRIGTIARVAPEKDLVTLLRGFAEALNTNPQIRLIIIGGCPKGHEIYQREVLRFIADNKLEDHVALLGDRQDAIQILKCLDVYASSSLTEGLPLSLLEAFAAEIPVVATDIPGNKDVVRNSLYGLLLPQNTGHGLAKGILKAIAMTPEEREALTHNCLNRIQEKFSLEAMIRDTMSLYKDILNIH